MNNVIRFMSVEVFYNIFQLHSKYTPRMFFEENFSILWATNIKAINY